MCVCFSEVAVEVPFKLMHPKPDPGELQFQICDLQRAFPPLIIIVCDVLMSLSFLSLFLFHVKRGKLFVSQYIFPIRVFTVINPVEI